MKRPKRDRHEVGEAPSVKVSVPIPKTSPKPAIKPVHPIGNLGHWAHPSKRAKKK